ncbi:hypothetical protein DFH08DRAFT_979719 [Mycena albidolilacea]|uniref:Uncharacterized protein n=1 Tax=Mycena albidolilacea TaxID=1033008 RepID=A0AAD6YVW0_9AGAR|nr:hypothetical protein DFH08DRAFT_979719 [Mycena albidolilacea]
MSSPWDEPALSACDCERAEGPDPEACTLSQRPLRAADVPVPAPPLLPSLHYWSHTQCCRLLTANHTLDEGEGIETFWRKPFPRTDPYALETAWAFSAPLVPTHQVPTDCRQLLPGNVHDAQRSVASLRIQYTPTLRYILAHDNGYNALILGRLTLHRMEERLVCARRRLAIVVPFRAKRPRADDDSAGMPPLTPPAPTTW